MLVHTVYFWLRPDLTEAQRAQFREGLESLKAIESLTQHHVGAPAGTPRRSTVDHSFSFGLLTVFKDVEGAAIYQVHPVHLKFLETFKGWYTRVQIYDSE